MKREIDQLVKQVVMALVGSGLLLYLVLPHWHSHESIDVCQGHDCTSFSVIFEEGSPKHQRSPKPKGPLVSEGTKEQEDCSICLFIQSLQPQIKHHLRIKLSRSLLAVHDLGESQVWVKKNNIQTFFKARDGPVLI